MQTDALVLPDPDKDLQQELANEDTALAGQQTVGVAVVKHATLDQAARQWARGSY